MVYIMVYFMVYLWYIDVYCHNAIRVTPKQTGSAAGSGIRSPGVSTQGAFSSCGWGRDEALGSFKHSFVFTNLLLFHHVSSVSAFSVGESGLKSSEDFHQWFLCFFILSYKSLKNSWQGGSLFAANNKPCGSLLQSDSLRGKKRMGSDRTASKSRTSGTAFAWWRSSPSLPSLT